MPAAPGPPGRVGWLRPVDALRLGGAGSRPVKVLIQRVTSARVTVAGNCVGAIGKGLLLLVGIEPSDGEDEVRAAADKVAGLRLFADDEGLMNLDVRQVGGGVLLVSQFTLAGSLRKGRRPSFDGAAPPDQARELVQALGHALEERGLAVAQGEFGADMQVELVNDGPVTFLLDLPLPPRRAAKG